MNVRPLLRTVFEQFFGTSQGLVDMIVGNAPSPLDGAKRKVERSYTGPMVDDVAVAMTRCDPRGPAMVQVVKLYPKQDASAFDAFGRVMSGTLRKGDVVRVLGESYSMDDEEDMAVKQITNLWIFESR
jgi:U5 small nuclear ribonucleoprotein component